MFSVVKTWDNRTRPVRIGPNGKSWTRRIQWLESQGSIKLKMEDGDQYEERLILQADADRVWRRFKDGQSIEDCLSILATPVPPPMKSRRAAKEDK